MAKPDKKTLAKFLADKKATETEGEIYHFMVQRMEKVGLAIQNKTIADGTGRFRTTVGYHLRNMLDKGLIKKSGDIHYVPVYPKTAA